MSIYSQHVIPIDIPAPVASSASSQKTAVVAESEFAPYHGHSEQNAWAEWGRRDNHHHYRHHHHQQQQQIPSHYHLFPSVPPRYPLTAYFPPPTAHGHRPASESTARRSRFCAVPGWSLRGAEPSRLAHVKGTVCVVLAIAVIFIVVLVLALVSNNKGNS
ncbi:hypothetical protein F5Y09DRAFT_344224 [Xylaria sp. FL1042]|nr:hypothetical protein F5Y09DRAFT_344224 [Xylaria sp. FL1042]